MSYDIHTKIGSHIITGTT